MRRGDSHPSTEQKIMKWNLSFGFEAWESPSTRTLSLTIFTMRNQRKMLCSWINGRRPAQYSSGFICLSCPGRSPQQQWDDCKAPRPTCQNVLPFPCPQSLGLMGPQAISNSSLHSPRGFPRTMLCLFMLPGSSGSFLLGMTFFKPYVTFIQALRLSLYVRGRMKKKGARQKVGPFTWSPILLKALIVPLSPCENQMRWQCRILATPHLWHAPRANHFSTSTHP